MGNREVRLVATLGRQRCVDFTMEEDCITVVWAEKFYGRSRLTDYLIAKEAHDDCQKMRTVSENPSNESENPNWDEALLLRGYRFSS